MSDSELASTIKEMLLQFQDGHVYLLSPFQKAVESDRWRKHLSNISKLYFTKGPFLETHDKIAWGFIHDSIGFVLFHTWNQNNEPSWIKMFDSVLCCMQNCKGLVIDIRPNQGGSDDNAEYVASHFIGKKCLFRYRVRKIGKGQPSKFGTPRPSYIEPSKSLQYIRRPVDVLISKENGSAANAFILMMKCAVNVRIIGDTSSGCSSIPATHQLPNGWKYTLSVGYNCDSKQHLYEDIGIAPDIWVHDKRGYFGYYYPGKDTVLDVALQDIKARSTAYLHTVQQP